MLINSSRRGTIFVLVLNTPCLYHVIANIWYIHLIWAVVQHNLYASKVLSKETLGTRNLKDQVRKAQDNVIEITFPTAECYPLQKRSRRSE